MQELLDKAASFTGHRPDKLGGYDMKNPTMMILKEKLLIVIEDLILNHGIVRFISGGALGTDQAAFWCVEILKKKYPHIQNVLAIPYSDQGKKREWDDEKKKYVGWSEEQAAWYDKMKQRADELVYVDTVNGYNRDRRTPEGKHSNYKLQVRNEYMVDHSRIVVAVWNGDRKKSGTWNCIDYALKQNSKEFIRINTSNHFNIEPLVA